jgi:uncharacterized damage-inducible protein DinB
MPADRSHIQENEAQRQRLRDFVAKVTDTELQRPLEAGWTVAGVLGHVAFWDQRTLLLLERWSRDGSFPSPELDAPTVDWINDAAKPMLLAVPPREMANLALSIADAVDRKVASLPEDFMTRHPAARTQVNLSRAEHRREHLDEIERALGR